MNYLKQILIILSVSFAAETIKYILPFPIPASIYGIGIMFTCLMTGIIKEEQIADVADYMIAIMPIFIIEPSVALMNSLGLVRGKVIQILIAAFVSTVAANLVTAAVSSLIMGMKEKCQTESENISRKKFFAQNGEGAE